MYLVPTSDWAIKLEKKKAMFGTPIFTEFMLISVYSPLM